MKVTFCGHGEADNAAESIAAWLDELLPQLIAHGAVTFYLGGYGFFDGLAAAAVRRQKVLNPHIESVLVQPYLNTNRDVRGYDRTTYPPLETVPKRLAILKRNEWMVDASDVVVCYVLHGWGGAAKTMAYAKRKHKPVISYPNMIPS